MYVHVCTVPCVYWNTYVFTGTPKKPLNEESDSKPRPKRRAAKNVATNAYLDDDPFDSPALSGCDDDDDDSFEQVARGSSGRGRRGRRKGRMELKVPRVKIKMIGRTRDNDSPIFCAQSLEEVSLEQVCMVL